MQHRAEILAELQAEFGKKKLLTPQDIAPHIARSPQAQANLRCRGRFPLAKKVQGRIVISIYDLADFLDDPESFDSEAGPASTAPAPPASPRLKASKSHTSKATRRPPSLSKTSLARGMLGDVGLRADQVQDGFRAQNPRFMEPALGRNNARIDGFRAFCAERGWGVPATALAWVMPAGDHVIPIPGTRAAARLRQWLPMPTLTPDDMAAIAQILPAGFAAGDRYGDHQLQGIERYC